MISDHRLIKVLLLSLLGVASHAIARNVAPATASQIGVGAQYDTTHVYVAPEDVDRFVASFLATFGGQSTKQVVATVTPTSSSTTSQLLQTPVGTVSVFGFKTPIPYPFGAERTGYLVTDMDKAIALAKASGADIVVATFPDPIGRDAVIQWPGGINMQLYWHTTKPSYAAFETIPENRVYVSPGRADAFTRRLSSLLARKGGLGRVARSWYRGGSTQRFDSPNSHRVRVWQDDGVRYRGSPPISLRA